MVDRKNYGVVTPLLVRGDGKGNHSICKSSEFNQEMEKKKHTPKEEKGKETEKEKIKEKKKRRKYLHALTYYV